MSQHPPSTSKRRKFLTIEEKMKVIDMREQGNSIKVIADHFDVSQTTVMVTVKKKEEIRLAWDDGCAPDRKMFRRKPVHQEVEQEILKWVQTTKDENGMLMSKSATKKKVKQLAAECGYNIKASNGWLHAFKLRHNLYKVGMEGKLKQLSSALQYNSACQGKLATESQNGRETELQDVINHDLRDIFICFSVGLFFKALPKKGYLQKPKRCVDGKRADSRISVLLVCSGSGEKLSPLVVGNDQSVDLSHNPRSAEFSLDYMSQSNSWLTERHVDACLTQLNRRLSQERRKVVLMLDANIPAGNRSLSHIDIQGMDSVSTQAFLSGIAHPLKVNYRRKFLKHLMCLRSEDVTASDLADQITVLDALVWLHSAWEELPTSDIRNTFLRYRMDEKPVIERGEHGGTVDDDITRTMLPDDVTLEDFARIDDSLITYQAANFSDEEELESVEDHLGESELQLPSCAKVHKAMKCLEKVKRLALQTSHPYLLHHVRQAQYCLASQQTPAE